MRTRRDVSKKFAKQSVHDAWTDTSIHELCMPLNFIDASDVVRFPSTLGVEAGYGVKAVNHIKQDHVIGEYIGKIVKASDSDPQWSMINSRGPDFMIDASTSRRTCTVRFINDAPPLLANCIGRELYADGRVFIVAKCPIAAESELFYYYGPDYPRKWLKTDA